jgi:phosphoribosylanthranilate isomerase
MTKIKICGIKDTRTLLAAADSGADFIGFVFAPSIRQVTPGTARSLRKALDQLDIRPLTVGVFVNSDVRIVNRIACDCNLDWVQLSGDESWDYCCNIERPFIKVMHITPQMGVNELLREIDAGYQIMPGRFICLLDTGAPKSYGGTGETFNWSIAREIAIRYPVIVAGGLTPDNTGNLIKKVNPWGVDVSTGVETEGEKDETKIRNFINAVREAGRDPSLYDNMKTTEIKKF